GRSVWLFKLWTTFWTRRNPKRRSAKQPAKTANAARRRILPCSASTGRENSCDRSLSRPVRLSGLWARARRYCSASPIFWRRAVVDGMLPFDSPPWQRRGKGWFDQYPNRLLKICEDVDQTTPNPSLAKEGNQTRKPTLINEETA